MELNTIAIGAATILVNVGGQVPLALTGTIERKPYYGRHDALKVLFPKKVEVEGSIREEEDFLVLNVISAILPPGFPLTIAQLLGTLAINIDYVILVTPVEV